MISTFGTIHLSLLEREILMNVDEEFEYLVRDKDGNLFVYTTNPEKRFYGAWTGEESTEMPVKRLFQSVQWEDEEAFRFRRRLENWNQTIDICGLVCYYDDSKES